MELRVYVCVCVCVCVCSVASGVYDSATLLTIARQASGGWLKT